MTNEEKLFLLEAFYAFLYSQEKFTGSLAAKDDLLRLSRAILQSRPACMSTRSRFFQVLKKKPSLLRKAKKLAYSWDSSICKRCHHGTNYQWHRGPRDWSCECGLERMQPTTIWEQEHGSTHP